MISLHNKHERDAQQETYNKQYERRRKRRTKNTNKVDDTYLECTKYTTIASLMGIQPDFCLGDVGKCYVRGVLQVNRLIQYHHFAASTPDEVMADEGTPVRPS